MLASCMLHIYKIILLLDVFFSHLIIEALQVKGTKLNSVARLLIYKTLGLCNRVSVSNIVLFDN